MKNSILIFLSVMTFFALNAQTSLRVKDAKGLNPGEKAPLFTALNADSNLVSLENTLEDGPVVLIFYRGFWCPVCNRHLSAIQDSLKLIEETGAKVIAVSPEKPEYLDKMKNNTGAMFSLLYDDGYNISDAYGVNFKPSSFLLFTYNTFTQGNLKKSHSDDSQRLPIPATYIINQEGSIIWRQFDPDYKNRASVKEILIILNKIEEVD